MMKKSLTPDIPSFYSSFSHNNNNNNNNTIGYSIFNSVEQLNMSLLDYTIEKHLQIRQKMYSNNNDNIDDKNDKEDNKNIEIV